MPRTARGTQTSSNMRDLRRTLADRDREIAQLKSQLAALEALADTDPLTPTLNRRAFIREVKRALMGYERYQLPVCVLLCDLDGFKQLNDQYGHLVGDEMLKHVAAILNANVRGTDAVGRMGGDEFALVLTHLSAGEAMAKAERLEQVVCESPLVLDGIEHRIGASFGAHFVDQLEAPELVLQRADEAMYVRKAQRRRKS